MAAPLSDRPDDHHANGSVRPFDRSSLEQSLADAMRNPEPVVGPSGSTVAAQSTPPQIRPDPFRPVDAGRAPLNPVNHVGLRRALPEPTPSTPPPFPGADPTLAPVPIIPASLRLLAPPPVETPPPDTEAEAAPAIDPGDAGPTVALAPWRPEDDDILPLHKARRRFRR